MLQSNRARDHPTHQRARNDQAHHPKHGRHRMQEKSRAKEKEVVPQRRDGVVQTRRVRTIRVHKVGKIALRFFHCWSDQTLTQWRDRGTGGCRTPSLRDGNHHASDGLRERRRGFFASLLYFTLTVSAVTGFNLQKSLHCQYTTALNEKQHW
jgi:hypothetical protein